MKADIDLIKKLKPYTKTCPLCGTTIYSSEPINDTMCDECGEILEN